MDREMLKYMDDVKAFYTSKQKKLTTEQIINIIFKKTEGSKEKVVQTDTSIKEIKSKDNGVQLNLSLESINQNRSNNNLYYMVKTEQFLTSHRPFIGRFIIWGKKIVRKLLRWYINPIIEQQNRFNGSITATTNDMFNSLVVAENNFINITNRVSELQANSDILYEKIEELTLQNTIFKKTIEKKEIYNKQLEDELTNRMTQITNDTERLEDELTNRVTQITNDAVQLEVDLTNKAIQLDEDIHQLGNNIASDMKNEISSRIEDISFVYSSKIEQVTEDMQIIEENMREDISYLSYKTKKIYKSNNINSSKSEMKKNETNEIQESANNIDYFLFENRFRGSQAKVKENSKKYVEYFKGAENILDIGCGRGELLELLGESGITAKGIDIEEDFVEYCIDKGLDVSKIDAISYLNTIEDNSLGGIFLGQVVEHLTNDYLVSFLELAYKKLGNGGVIIAETPNPTMLLTFINAFYIDPTHVKPVHPETLKFLLEYNGFKEIDIKFSESSKIQYNLPLLQGEHISNLLEFNNGINVLNDKLFGYQDYAAIAIK